MSSTRDENKQKVFPLWEHQVKGIQNALSNRDYAFLFEMGTGKTRTTIETLRRRYAQAGRIQKTLILAPKIVCPKWKAEFGVYSKVRQRSIAVLDGSQTKRVTTMLALVGDNLQGEGIIVTNYESMGMDNLFKLIMQWGVEVLVCDESQKLKNHQSKRAKKVMDIADTTHHNLLLTGSPILQSAMDLFMQFRILDRGDTLGKNFYGFRAQYFHDANARWKGKQSYFPKWEERLDTFDRLQEKIKAKSMRVLKSECLDLPPLVKEIIDVPMSPAQAKAYREMYNDYITFIEDSKGKPRAVVAQLAVTKMLRLQQITSGFVNDDAGNSIRFKDVPRLEALKDLLETLVVESGNKVIVWAVFKENYKMIAEVCESLGIKYTEITGDTKDKEAAMHQFRTDPDTKVVIANQGAGGVGIDLVEAAYMIYYSKGLKLEDDMQSEARNYRGGSEMHSKVTRYDLRVPNTVDQAINEKLALKQHIGDSILSWNENIKG